ncbi:MAG TPA: ATP-binding protein [Thermoanaerobaculia bacterium]|nr:ATP-binding protein [Thermoanaerobaculia bacterium]
MEQDDQERIRGEAQRRQASRMEAVGQLAGGIAHDFNNLLTAILGYAQLLSERPLGDAALAEVAEIRHAAESAASLTRQLLAFSRQQVQKISVFVLNDVVSETESMLARLLGEDVRICKELAPGLGRVKADPGQIEQVLVNLAVNARDAMPKGGTLRIETRDVDLDEAYVDTHVAGTPGPYVMLAMSDDGCGMDPATLARIFEPFFTTKPVGKGTGLGLATVYGIVKQSGGFVWVYSDPGHGTTFRIYLPRVEEPLSARRDSGTPRRTPPKGTETILLVEDDDAVRRFVRDVLVRNGYTVHAAASGNEAVNAARPIAPAIHLVLSDVVMPEMSGAVLRRRLEALGVKARVLFMSGHSADAVAVRGIEAGDGAFLQKPFTPGDLLFKVRRVLDGG